MMNNKVEKIKNKIIIYKVELAKIEKSYKELGSLNLSERNNLDRLKFVIGHYENKLRSALKNSAEGNSESDVERTIPHVKITNNEYLTKAKKLEAKIQTFFS